MNTKPMELGDVDSVSARCGAKVAWGHFAKEEQDYNSTTNEPIREVGSQVRHKQIGLDIGCSQLNCHLHGSQKPMNCHTPLSHSQQLDH